MMQRNGHEGRAMMNPPPGGFAGIAQQTSATQLGTVLAVGPSRLMRRAASRGAGKRYSARRVARGSAKRQKTPRRGGGSRKKAAHLVKGSAAAKRRMAKLRRMQKRRR